MKTDQYKTLADRVEGVIFKEKKSKFYGYAYPVEDETRIEQLRSALREKHGKANHFCYGWQLGTDPVLWRVSDDGEPSNSAGMPIYGQIQAFGLTDVLLVVVRYFGGTKLGVGGLISAYRKTAQLTLEEGEIITRQRFRELVIEFDYEVVHSVIQLVKHLEIEILSEEHGMRAKYVLGVPLNRFERALSRFRGIHKVEILS